MTIICCLETALIYKGGYIGWIIKKAREFQRNIYFCFIDYAKAFDFVKVKESESEVVQLCPTICDPMDCSLSGSSIHGIFQARVLEWIAIAFSRGSSLPRDRTLPPALQADALPSEPPGKPLRREVYR